MADEPIIYSSQRFNTPTNLTQFDTSENKGVKCVCKGQSQFNGYNAFTELTLYWDFDWSELKASGVDGLSGHITVTDHNGNLPQTKIDVDMTESIQTVQKVIQNGSSHSGYAITFNYSLIPHRSRIEDVFYDEMFLPSEMNDTILVVDGKKLNVNKAFLSYHSDFFRALFSSNYKEGQMDEIPIKDVSYEDFGLVMSTIYPKTQFPSDGTVEKLLQLADRFLIPSVIGHVEYHLLHNSIIDNEKKTWMADEYGMPKLLEKCVRELNSLQKAKNLKASPEYKKLSNDAKGKILDRVMELI